MEFINFYEEENEKHYYKYQESLSRISDIRIELDSYSEENVNYKYYLFLKPISAFILEIAELEKEIDGEYFTSKSFEELMNQNANLYKELLPENYNNSYVNPTYAVSVFGNSLGLIFSRIYCMFKKEVSFVHKHKIFLLEIYNRFFIELYTYIKKNDVSVNGLKKIVSDFEYNNIHITYKYFFKENYSKDVSFYNDILLNSNFNDLRYLFKYGIYITENEIKTARYLLNYPSDNLIELTDSIAKSYVDGFKRDNKDIKKRSDVRIACSIGYEKLVKHLIKSLEKYNLNGFVSEIASTNLNKQFSYDHTFDNTLYLTDEYFDKSLEIFGKEAKREEDVLSSYSGIIAVETFGEEPFTPESKKERLKLTNNQQKSYQKYKNNIRAEIDKYLPEIETSFCIVAFPTPEIGNNFAQIFQEIVTINMLDSDIYERIQQILIDALDKGEYIHVKGKGSNQTDIKVKMHEIADSNKETNFENCVADVNIPVGEVFTSPILKGTNGVLHVEEVYLEDFKYENLKLTFKNGYVNKYACTNFKERSLNKEYIRENLLFPHKTLPIGEFAIGTNTLAYVVAEKYDILDKLPILIIEKMGPHFAIGDTCFAWAEDIPVFNNLDKKEIIARDNEKSILRKKDISKAYTNKHIDITLPYKSLMFIDVISKSGDKIRIIENGRFVLEGLEELNEPFNDK